MCCLIHTLRVCVFFICWSLLCHMNITSYADSTLLRYNLTFSNMYKFNCIQSKHVNKCTGTHPLMQIKTWNNSTTPENYLVPICNQSHSPKATTILISKTHRSLLPALDLLINVVTQCLSFAFSFFHSTHFETHLIVTYSFGGNTMAPEAPSGKSK